MKYKYSGGSDKGLSIKDTISYYGKRLLHSHLKVHLYMYVASSSIIR